MNIYGTAHQRKLAYQSGAAKISPKSILEADVNFLGKAGVLTQHSPLWDASVYISCAFASTWDDTAMLSICIKSVPESTVLGTPSPGCEEIIPGGRIIGIGDEVGAVEIVDVVNITSI